LKPFLRRPQFCIIRRMDSAELLARAKRFALDSLALYRTLSKAPEAQVPGVQFYTAATSAWMNYRSSKRGRSRPDFISKLGIAVEEIDETASLTTARANWKAEQTARRRKKRARSIVVKLPEPRF
jgi:four helix bundle protein